MNIVVTPQSLKVGEVVRNCFVDENLTFHRQITCRVMRNATRQEYVSAYIERYPNLQQTLRKLELKYPVLKFYAIHAD